MGDNMEQKLSAMNYIKNNKKRVSVLIVSLSLCFVLFYLTQFLLSTTEETMSSIAIENAKKIQYASLSTQTLGAETNEEYEKKLSELADKLKKHEGVNEIYLSDFIYVPVAPAIGRLYYELPLVKKEELTEILERVGTKVIEGRLPKEKWEIVLDSASMKNNNFELNGYTDEDKVYKIVGILDTDQYFGCGLSSDESSARIMMIFSEGIEDISAELRKEGIKINQNFGDEVYDYKWGEKYIKEEVVDAIENSEKIIYAGIIIVLFISLIVVYTMYLRDRHNELCLYYSIGYSRKTIYFSIMKEILFTFGIALIAGGLIILSSVILMKYLFIEPQGIKCQYLQLRTIFEILCEYVLLIGVLQLPIRYALYKIRTIDAIEDDLY